MVIIGGNQERFFVVVVHISSGALFFGGRADYRQW